MSASVTIDLATGGKGTLADPAFVGLFSRVSTLMDLDVSDTDETLRAKTALQGLIVPVRALVDTERTSCTVDVTTLLTHKRCFASMRADVVLIPALLVEHLRTIRTRHRLILVQTRVESPTADRWEFHVTVTALVRRLAHEISTVTFQLPRLLIDDVTVFTLVVAFLPAFGTRFGFPHGLGVDGQGGARSYTIPGMPQFSLLFHFLKCKKKK